MKLKKAQVTVFIIIGIMLLFSALLILYITTKQKEPQPLPIESKGKITMFVDSCLQTTAEDVLTKIGHNGGYTGIGNFDKLSAEIDPFNSDLLSLDGGRLKIPYWYYQKNGVDKLNIPTLEKKYDGDDSIQDRMEKYVAENINTCIDNFSTFRDQNIVITPTANPMVTVEFGSDNTIFNLNYSLSVKGYLNNESVGQFSATIPVALKRVYNLASQITMLERNTVFLERKTMDLVSLYSETEKDYLPPPYGALNFGSCGEEKFWMYNQVEGDVRNMLAFNIPFIKISNAKYDRIMVTPDMEPDPELRKMRQGVFDGLRVRVSRDLYPYTTATIFFDQNYPMKLDLGTKGILEPNSVEINLLFAQLCMFDYKFTYDLSYPVIVSISDDLSTINNNKYTFMVPLQVVIKDNFPRIRVSDIAPEPLPAQQQSFFCDESSKTANLTVKVVDNEGNPVNSSSIYFQCGPEYVYNYDENGTLKNMTAFSDKCYIGTTDEKGILAQKFPECYGAGIIDVKADNYLEQTQVVGDVLNNQTKSVNITLDKVKTMKIKVKKYLVTPPNENDNNTDIVVDENMSVLKCDIRSNELNLLAPESALVKLEKLDLENGILNAMPVAIFKDDNESENTLNIAPGKYLVNIMLIRAERYPGEMTIKKNSKCKSVPTGMFSSPKQICYPDQDVLMPEEITGGAEYIFNIGPEVYDNNLLTFYVIDEGITSDIDQIGASSNHLDKCAELNKDLIRPKFSK